MTYDISASLTIFSILILILTVMSFIALVFAVIGMAVGDIELPKGKSLVDAFRERIPHEAFSDSVDAAMVDAAYWVLRLFVFLFVLLMFLSGLKI